MFIIRCYSLQDCLDMVNGCIYISSLYKLQTNSRSITLWEINWMQLVTIAWASNDTQLIL